MKIPNKFYGICKECKNPVPKGTGFAIAKNNNKWEVICAVCVNPNKQLEVEMDNFRVVEKENHLAVHCITWSMERGLAWIDHYGDSHMFTDESLTADSFEVIEVQQ